jgi:glycine/serine hydroxymethyltransferase
MDTDAMRKIVSFIDLIITNHDDEALQIKTKSEVKQLCKAFPLYE